jgi:hypothetical protein
LRDAIDCPFLLCYSIPNIRHSCEGRNPALSAGSDLKKLDPSLRWGDGKRV